MDILAQRVQTFFQPNVIHNLFPVKVYHPDHHCFVIDNDTETDYIGFAYICAPYSQQGQPDLENLFSAPFPDNTWVSFHNIAFSDCTAISQLAPPQYPLTPPLDKVVASKYDCLADCVDKYMIMTVKYPVKTDETVNEQTMIALRDQQRDVEDILKQAGFITHHVDHEMYLMLNRAILHSQPNKHNNMDVNAELYEQVTSKQSKITVQADHISIDEWYCRSLSVQSFPASLSTNMWSQFVSIGQDNHNALTGSYCINTHIFFDNKDTFLSNNTPPWEYAEEGHNALTRRIIDDNKRGVKVWTNMLIFAESLTALDNKTTAVKNHALKQDILLNIDVYNQGTSLQPQFLMNINDCALLQKHQFIDTDSSQISNYICLHNEFKGNGLNVTNTYKGFNHQLICYDNRSEDSHISLLIGNAQYDHTLILYDMLEQTLSQRRSAIIIDNTGEMMKFFEAFSALLPNHVFNAVDSLHRLYLTNDETQVPDTHDNDNDNNANADAVEFGIWYCPGWQATNNHAYINDVITTVLNTHQQACEQTPHTAQEKPHIMITGFASFLPTAKMGTQAWEEEEAINLQGLIDHHFPLLFSTHQYQDIEKINWPVHSVFLCHQQEHDRHNMSVLNTFNLPAHVYTNMNVLGNDNNESLKFYLHNCTTHNGGYCAIVKTKPKKSASEATPENESSA